MLQRLRQALRGDEIEHCDKDEDWSGASPIKLRSTGYKRGDDGSVTLSVTLDKDQVECCVCFSSMTDLIFRCRAPGSICHNVCGDCEWQIRRMKSANGHTKEPKCPICKADGTFVRNRSLERQLQEISSPCRNSEKGCKIRFFPWDESTEEEHQRACVFDPIACPICNRAISGGRSSLVTHLRAPTVPLTPYEMSVKNASGGLSNGIGVMNSILDAEDQGQEEEDDRKENESDGSVPVLVGDSPQQQQRNVNDGDNEDEQNNADNEDVPNLLDDDNNNNDAVDHERELQDVSESEVIGCGLPITEATLTHLDTNKMSCFVLGREHTFLVNEKYGYVLLLLAPDEQRQAWKVYCFSSADYHRVTGNNRVYLQYTPLEYDDSYREVEASMGLLGDSLVMPALNTLSLAMNRIQSIEFVRWTMSQMNSNPTDNVNSTNFTFNQINKRGPHIACPEAPWQCGYIFAGTNPSSHLSQLRVRLYTLTESFKIGAIIDARDFMGKWYQAEIIKIAHRGCSENSATPDESSGIPIRRIKVHYLGYSANYDEWLDVDTDSHRMAQRGTFTVGPDLRALRRYAQHGANHVPLPRVLARSAALANINEND